ncbi:hypothetical protein CHC151_14900 [Helicobacter pylori]
MAVRFGVIFITDNYTIDRRVGNYCFYGIYKRIRYSIQFNIELFAIKKEQGN